MLCLLSALRNNEQGVTAVEYGMIAALIAIAIIAAIIGLGTSLSGIFQSLGNTI